MNSPPDGFLFGTVALSGMPLVKEILPPGSAAFGSSAEVWLSANAVPTPMPVQNAYVPINGAFQADLAPLGMTIALPTGVITCVRPGRFKTLATIAFTTPAGVSTIQFSVFKNGVALPEHTAITWTDTNAFPNTVSITGLDDLVAGDVLDVRVQCTTAAGVSITVTNMNFSVTT